MLPNYMALKTWYKRAGNWEEAVKLCEKAHQLDSASPEISTELAYLYLKHGGNPNAAVSLAQQAKEKMPDSTMASSDMLGWAHFKVGASSAAIAQLRQSVVKEPSNPIYQYHLGTAYASAGDYKPAEEALQRALKDNPDFAFAGEAKASLARIRQLRN